MLALTPAEQARAGELLVTRLGDYERNLATTPLIPSLSTEALTDLLSIPDSGIGVDGVFASIREKIIPNSTAVAHPRFLAYVLGPPNGIAPYAEAIAARPSTRTVAGPQAAAMEDPDRCRRANRPGAGRMLTPVASPSPRAFPDHQTPFDGHVSDRPRLAEGESDRLDPRVRERERDRGESRGHVHR